MDDVLKASRERDPEQLLVRVETAARMCSISRSRVFELIASGEIPSVSIGRSRRIPVEALRTWIIDRLERGAA